MTTRNVLAVILWMTGTLLSFSLTAVAVRALADAFTLFQLLGLRAAAAVVVLVAAALLRPGLRGDLAPRRLPLHGVRNLMHFGAQYAWAYGLTLLPFATVFALEFTTPAWVGLLAVVFLREQLTASRAVSIALGFAGVLIILRPGLATLQAAALVVLASAFGFAATSITTKKLTTTESTFAILFWMNLMQLVFNAVGDALAGGDWLFWTRIGAGNILPIIGLCIGGFAAHLCLTNAYRHGDAIMVIPLDFLRLPLIAAVGWLFYGEQVDAWVFVGALVIIAGILFNLRAETRR